MKWQQKQQDEYGSDMGSVPSPKMECKVDAKYVCLCYVWLCVGQVVSVIFNLW